VTVTELDSGSTGIAHNADLTHNVVVKANLDCGGTGPACGQCDIAGVNPEPRNCRCEGLNQNICDEPFVADNDDCAGAVCNCYVGPPLSLSAGNTPACIVNRLATDVTGTTNVDEGSGATSLDLRSIVFLGEALNVPCPACGGTCTAGLPNTSTCFFNSDCDTNFGQGDGVCGNYDDAIADGNKNGTCYLGRNNGTACDVDAESTSFPAPGGGGHSLDCFPTAGKNVSGAGLIIRLNQTTGTSSLASNIPCGFGDPFLCPCGLCTLDTTIPCNSNTDCGASGECKKQTNFKPTPNSCDNTCNDIGGEEGECNGPTDLGCDGILRADDSPFIQCTTNADCDPVNIGLPGGNCAIQTKRACFLPTIVATGAADPKFPIGAATFCIAPTSNPGINDTAGLPGPGRVTNQGIVQFHCANGDYEAGVGCPP
jgi:hypothetical protein